MRTAVRARILVTLKPSDIAWLILLGAVVAYDATAKDGETLSEGIDRLLVKHPWLTRIVVGLTACHLLNITPPVVDPWAWAWHADRLLRRRRVVAAQ